MATQTHETLDKFSSAVEESATKRPARRLRIEALEQRLAPSTGGQVDPPWGDFTNPPPGGTGPSFP